MTSIFTSLVVVLENNVGIADIVFCVQIDSERIQALRTKSQREIKRNKRSSHKMHKNISKVKARMENNALVWVPNYICIVGGEVLEFLSHNHFCHRV